MTAKYHPIGCARLVSAIMDLSFKQIRDLRDEQKGWKFLNTPLAEHWCAVLGYDQERIKEQALYVYAKSKRNRGLPIVYSQPIDPHAN